MERKSRKIKGKEGNFLLRERKIKQKMTHDRIKKSSKNKCGALKRRIDL